MAAPCTSITDDRLAVLLEEIFLRLPTPADLVRASAACVPFRQIATGSSFLRRFRKEQPPSLIGLMDWHGFRPALPPHTAAPVAGAVARAADLTFSFLPRPTRYSLLPDPDFWCVRSIRDGRVLLDRGPKREKGSVVFSELVVCDPLHRRYHLLPPIPDDLAASVRDPLHLTYRRSCEVILVPPGKEVQEDKEEHDFIPCNLDGTMQDQGGGIRLFFNNGPVAIHPIKGLERFVSLQHANHIFEVQFVLQ